MVTAALEVLPVATLFLVTHPDTPFRPLSFSTSQVQLLHVAARFLRCHPSRENNTDGTPSMYEEKKSNEAEAHLLLELAARAQQQWKMRQALLLVQALTRRLHQLGYCPARADYQRRDSCMNRHEIDCATHCALRYAYCITVPFRVYMSQKNKQ